MVTCYVATKMTNRDKREQVQRAKYVCAILRQFGVNPISPVLAENVEDKPGALINDNYDRLAGFWKRDKEIIRYEAQVVLIDGAHDKSFGVEREYALNRHCLWKPTVLLMPDVGLTVATMEDDYIAHDIHEAGKYIRDNWGTWFKRAKWRVRMLIRTLPKFIISQCFAWK